MNYEVIIIGAGPAGWSAAIFLARVGVKVLVIGRQEESGLTDATDVWNYPGFTKGVNGPELLDRMMTQALEQGAVFKKDEVTHAQKEVDDSSWNSEMDRFLVRTSDHTEFRSRSLLLAHGANYIKTDLPGESEFKGKGVHYCAICDGALYKGKKIIVIGNGNYAAEEAVELTAFSENIQIFTHAAEPNFSQEYLDLLKKYNIGIVNQRVSEISGVQGVITGITVHPPVSRQESIGVKLAYTADAVFIALGVASSLAFGQQLGLEMNGNFIKTDHLMRTNVPGVWAAGLACGGVNQIVKSVGDGGTAAVDIIKTMKDLPQYIDHT